MSEKQCIFFPEKKLPRLVLESGLTPLQYEVASASLEEVFMELVGEDGGGI